MAGVPDGTKLGAWQFLVMISDLEISSLNVIFVDDTTSFENVSFSTFSRMLEYTKILPLIETRFTL